jgi:hypothetical protein
MPGAFLYDNAMRGATLFSAAATVGTMPLSNLQDPQPRRRARLMGSSASIIADMGANVSVDCAALISTTLGAGATMRARVGNEAGIVEVTPLVGLDFLQATPSSMAAWSAARGGAGGAGEATYFDAAGNLAIAAAGEWRIDHDPITRERRGLLLEPARTNIALRSRDFTQAAWVKTNITAARDVAGIDGVANTASRLTATAGNATVLQTITSASAGHVTSFFVQRITGAGTLEITQNNGATWTAITLTAAWQRFIIPVATVTNPVIGFRIVTSGDVIAVDVAQCEVGAFATSPIITSAAAVTRAADGGTLPVALPGSFTLFSESRHVVFTNEAGLNFPSFFTVSEPSGLLGGMQHRVYGASGVFVADSFLSASGLGIADFGDIGISVGQVLAQATAYAANDMAYSLNGGAIQTDLSGVLPALSQIQIGQGDAITHLRRLRLYGSRLSNAQLVALSGTGSTLVPTEITGDTGAIAAEAEDANQGNVILTLPAPAVGRYLRIDITNPTAAFTDIGVLAAGGLWRLLRGTAYGIREGRVMLDRRDRNPFTGAEFPVPAIANPRMAAFTLPSLSTSEARNQHRALVRLLGAAGDALWIAELNDTLAERNRRAIWGAVNVPGEDAAVSRDSFPLSSRAFRVTERL